MRTTFPGIEAACTASTEAMALQYAAQSKAERARADNASRRATELAVTAYGEELLPALFGGQWHLSRRNGRYPEAVLISRYDPFVAQFTHALFDHPLVFRNGGTRGPDGPKNTVIIGRPYGAVVGGSLADSARESAAYFARLGWGIWWRPDLSTHYPGWTQLVLAKHGLQACGVADGFLPLASPGLGVSAWDEWKSQP